jgi:hypothetical protein
MRSISTYRKVGAFLYCVKTPDFNTYYMFARDSRPMIKVPDTCTSVDVVT